MNVPRAYEDFVNFIVSGTTPEVVLAYQPRSEASDRVEQLVFKSKTEGLSQSEQSELEHYLHLELVMRLAKSRAHQYLKS